MKKSFLKFFTNTATPLWVTIILGILPLVVALIIFIQQNNIIEKQLDIANQQNSISLFEKRYELYYEILNLKISIAYITDEVFLNSFINQQAYYSLCFLMTGYNNPKIDELLKHAPDYALLHPDIMDLTSNLHKIQLLFNLDIDNLKMLYMILESIKSIHNKMSVNISSNITTEISQIKDILYNKSFIKTLRAQTQITNTNNID